MEKQNITVPAQTALPLNTAKFSNNIGLTILGSLLIAFLTTLIFLIPIGILYAESRLGGFFSFASRARVYQEATVMIFSGAVLIPLFSMIGAVIGKMQAKKVAIRAFNIQTMGAIRNNPAAVEDVNDLAARVRSISRLAGMQTVPDAGIIQDKYINALAIGSSRRDSLVAVTDGALHSFDEQQLNGIIAHEIGHIVNGDMQLLVYLNAFQNTLTGFLFFHNLKMTARMLILWGTELWLRKLARSREFRADAIAAGVVGEDAVLGYLQAFQELDDPHLNRRRQRLKNLLIYTRNRGGLMQTHPSTAARIAFIKSGQYKRYLPVMAPPSAAQAERIKPQKHTVSAQPSRKQAQPRKLVQSRKRHDPKYLPALATTGFVSFLAALVLVPRIFNGSLLTGVDRTLDPFYNTGYFIPQNVINEIAEQGVNVDCLRYLDSQFRKKRFWLPAGERIVVRVYEQTYNGKNHGHFLVTDYMNARRDIVMSCWPEERRADSEDNKASMLYPLYIKEIYDDEELKPDRVYVNFTEHLFGERQVYRGKHLTEFVMPALPAATAYPDPVVDADSPHFITNGAVRSLTQIGIPEYCLAELNRLLSTKALSGKSTLGYIKEKFQVFPLGVRIPSFQFEIFEQKIDNRLSHYAFILKKTSRSGSTIFRCFVGQEDNLENAYMIEHVSGNTNPDFATRPFEREGVVYQQTGKRIRYLTVVPSSARAYYD